MCSSRGVSDVGGFLLSGSCCLRLGRFAGPLVGCGFDVPSVEHDSVRFDVAFVPVTIDAVACRLVCASSVFTIVLFRARG